MKRFESPDPRPVAWGCVVAVLSLLLLSASSVADEVKITKASVPKGLDFIEAEGTFVAKAILLWKWEVSPDGKTFGQVQDFSKIDPKTKTWSGKSAPLPAGIWYFRVYIRTDKGDSVVPF